MVSRRIRILVGLAAVVVAGAVGALLRPIGGFAGFSDAKLLIFQRPDRGEVKRLPVRALKVGGEGVRVAVAERVALVLEAPRHRLEEGRWNIVVLGVREGGQVERLGHTSSPEPLVRIPNRETLYGLPTGVDFRWLQPGERALLVVRVSEDLTTGIPNLLPQPPQLEGFDARELLFHSATDGVVAGELVEGY